MNTLLAERPLIVSLMLATLASALVYGWLQSGKKALALVGLLLFALIPAAWVVAERWVTDRERIERLIYETADAVESNDHDRTLRLIGDPATRAQAAAELPRYEFTMADVGSIREITVLENTHPLRAEVDMTVKVDVSGRGVRNVRVPRRLLLTFEKRAAGEGDAQADRWVVTGYEHMPIVGTPDAYTTRPVQ